MMEPKKTIYFIRHGQSEANTDDVFQGPDSPLTKLGEEQARFVGERIKGVDAEVVITSPMPRAQQTADIIADLTNLPIEQNALVREYLPPTSLVGVSRTSDKGRTYVLQMLQNLDNPKWHYEDEENYHEMHDRAVELLTQLEERDEEKILIVTHVGILRVALTAMMTEFEPDAVTARRLMRFMKPMNTGITVCAYYPDAVRRSKWRLVAWNDHAHLAETDMEEPH